MNILITNTRNLQALSVIYSLKDYADTLVATIYGKNSTIAKLESLAAKSKYINKRYFVPNPIESWKPENICKKNSKREEEYVQAILDICDRESIDIVFPSRDAVVFILSKNKKRFEKSGILLPIPDFDTLINAMDKYRLLNIAQRNDVPCPKTYFPDDMSDLKDIIQEIKFPLVIKPRLSSASKGLYVVNNFSQLYEKYDLCQKEYGAPLIQEYIPGYPSAHVKCIYSLLDKRQQPKAFFSYEFVRSTYVNTGAFVTAARLINNQEIVKNNIKLLKKLNYYGFSSTDFKVDPRDGIPKLMEVNCRMGGRIWQSNAVGINFPLLSIKVEKGENFDFLKPTNEGKIFLDPIEDALALFTFSINCLARTINKKVPKVPLDAPPKYRDFLRSYRDTYCSRDKVYDECSRYFLDDPLVGLTRWMGAIGNVIFNPDKYLPD